MKSNMNIKLDMSGLEKLKSALKNNYEIRVGILGGDSNRDDEEGLTNAELGVIQEFGSATKNIPPRSFLRMPLETKAKEISKWLQRQDWEEALTEDELLTLLSKLGLKAENIVDDAFASAGFGQWAALKPATIAKKGSDAPLIDTGELRRSISSDVFEK